MITLLAYHPEFNLIELVFNTFLEILTCQRARYISLYIDAFIDVIHIELGKRTIVDGLNCVFHCGYSY